MYGCRRKERWKMAINKSLIKLARLHVNKTQKDLAQEIGTSKIYISMLENGKRSPSVPMAKLIAKALKIDWQDIFKE